MLGKRIFDMVIVIILSPLWLVLYFTCVIVLLVVQGLPIHFSQFRVGKSGREFKIYKFRSMIIDADKKGTFYTVKTDVRVTKIGKIFRATSLDELPQIFNVLKGDMSLVGPRPYLAVQKEQLNSSNWDKRLEVYPGITGLAQVKGRSDCSLADRERLDIEYVERRSLTFDVKILLETLKLVCLKKGTN